MITPAALGNAIADAIGVRGAVPPFTAPRIWAYVNGHDPDAGLREPEKDRAAASYAGLPLSGAGSVTLSAGQEAVWRALVDVSSLKQVIPGCREIAAAGPNLYEAIVDIRVAGIGGTYKARIELSDLEEPSALRLSSSAEGGLAAGEGHADVRLSGLPDGRTKLDFSYRAGVTGRVVSFGHRMLGSVTALLISRFFDGLEARLTGKRRGFSIRAMLRDLALLLRSLVR
jgi:2-furoyl-CoA dehydrogenase large subunit